MVIRLSDIKEEYQWLNRLEWCPDVGYHALIQCLKCKRKKRCSYAPKEVKKLRLSQVLKEELR